MGFGKWELEGSWAIEEAPTMTILRRALPSELMPYGQWVFAVFSG